MGRSWKSAAIVLISLLSLSGANMAAEPEAKPLIEADFVKLGDLNEAQWAASFVDGLDCRVLKGGVAGVVPLPAWWGEGARPLAPAAFVIHVKFKDTASEPIRVEIFSGLPGRSEIHRIGGLNDNQWKVASIPVGWDMVMRTSAKGTELAFFAPPKSDVPFQHIDVAVGKPAEDEARWAAETRDWVARVQAGIKDSKLPNPEQPVITDELKKFQLIPFIRSTSRLIYPNSAPQKGETYRLVKTVSESDVLPSAPLKIKMARNEIEPAQFGVYANGADLKNVRISVGKDGFRNVYGVGLKSKVTLFTAEYAVVRAGKDLPIFPQRLWPAFPVDIPNGRSHLFWITVGEEHSSPKAGVYTGKISIEADDQATMELPVEVDIADIELLTMKEAGLHMGGCTTGLLPAHELRILVENNQNSINLWYSGVAPKITKKPNKDFDLDYSIMDDFMRHAHDAGVENFVYFLGGNPYDFPDACHLERELYRQVVYDGANMMDGRKEFIRKTTQAPNVMLPELRTVYEAWVKKFMAHAQENHWPEPILTPFDEPAKWVQGDHAKIRLFYYVDQKTHSDRLPHINVKDVAQFQKTEEANGNKPEDLGEGGAAEWIKTHFKDSCAAIHEADPNARIYGSIHHAESGIVFKDDIEVFCTNAIHEDPKLGDKVRAGGPKKTFWQYSGCGTTSDLATARYTFGFFFGAFDSRGSLCWAYNWGARFDTTQGENWEYAWTTPYSIVRTPFFEGMREAWDDRRYIETLKAEAKKKGREKEADDLLAEIFNTAVKSRTAGGRDTVNDFWARTNDPEALDTMRGKIRDAILKLKQ